MERSTSVTPRTRVIGIGNDFGQDDGVGRLVARRLRLHAPRGVDILEHDGEGTSLLEAWEGVPQVVLVDAVKSGAPPGTIVRVDLQRSALPLDRGWFSSHTIGLADAVALARVLDRLPASLVVYGIEGERYEPGCGVSPAVACAAAALVDHLVGELTTSSRSAGRRPARRSPSTP